MNAKIFSLLLTPIYHSSVVVFGQEYSFGEDGQSWSKPGTPCEIHNAGNTFVTEKQIQKYLSSLESEFCASKYDVRDNNCNVFTATVCDYLCEELDFPACLKTQKILEKVFGGPLEASRRFSKKSSNSCKSLFIS